MTTNFFKSIADMALPAAWKLSIAQGSNGDIIVSVLLTNDKAGDDARKTIPPMILKGSPEEIDDNFFKTVTEPAQKTAALFTNMEQYLKQLDEAKAQSKMEQDKESKAKKEKDERKKKFDEAVKKVDELEEKKQYQLAIAALPKAEQFPEQSEQINKRLDDLRKKNGQLSLI
jgi:PRTRC genetic system protein E